MSGLIWGQAGLNSLNLPCVRLLIPNFHWLETDQVLRQAFHQFLVMLVWLVMYGYKGPMRIIIILVTVTIARF